MNRFLLFFLISFVVHIAMGALLLSRTGFFGGPQAEGSADIGDKGQVPSEEEEPTLTDTSLSPVEEEQEPLAPPSLINISEEREGPLEEAAKEKKLNKDISPETKKTTEPPKPAPVKKGKKKNKPALNKPTPPVKSPIKEQSMPTNSSVLAEPSVDVPQKPEPSENQNPLGTGAESVAMDEKAPAEDEPAPILKTIAGEEWVDEEDMVSISKENRTAVEDKTAKEEWVDEGEEVLTVQRQNPLTEEKWVDEEDILEPTTAGGLKTKRKALISKEASSFPLSPGNMAGAGDVPALDIGKARAHSQLRQVKGNPLPVYPETALKNKWEGRAEIFYYVDPAGFVEKIQLKRSSGHAVLDNSALRTLARYRYHPGQEGWVRHPVEFLLELDKEIKKTATLGGGGLRRSASQAK